MNTIAQLLLCIDHPVQTPAYSIPVRDWDYEILQFARERESGREDLVKTWAENPILPIDSYPSLLPRAPLIQARSSQRESSK